ncbi:MAG: hypothetical protein OEY93_06980, partial [Anaerolineae bacterium]|nr:hypothetical protein [Anaerolineae bacterium]
MQKKSDKNKKTFQRLIVVLLSVGGIILVIGSLFLNWELLPSRPLPTTPLPAFIPGVNLTATPPPPDTVTAFPDPSDYRWSLAAQGFELPVGIANAAD